MSTEMFTVGARYNRRRDIHARFGGQQQGGICTPANHPLLIIFTGDSGEAHGYADGWTEEGNYRYFGEGQVGDMEFVRGNRAIRDHLQDGKDILMFETLGGGQIRFLGEFVCCGYEFEQAPDREGDQRQAIVFELMPAETEAGQDVDQVETAIPAAPDLATLRDRALEAAQTTPRQQGREARRNYYQRSQAVRLYVLARAKGVCEGCGAKAPFTSKTGLPYLEPHHIRRLTDGGPDDPRFMAALCPNCHREIHHGIDGAEKNQRLQLAISEKEPT